MLFGNIQLQCHRMACHLEWRRRSRTFQATTEHYNLDTIFLKNPSLVLSLLEIREQKRLEMNQPGEENHQTTHLAPSWSFGRAPSLRLVRQYHTADKENHKITKINTLDNPVHGIFADIQNNCERSTYWVVATSIHDATDTIYEPRSSHSSLHKLAKLSRIIPASFVVWLHTLLKNVIGKERALRVRVVISFWYRYVNVCEQNNLPPSNKIPLRSYSFRQQKHYLGPFIQ